MVNFVQYDYISYYYIHYYKPRIAKLRPQSSTTKTPPMLTTFREDALDLSEFGLGQALVPCFHHLL